MRPAEYRYAAVLALTLVNVVWAIVTPDADWSRAVGFALASTALVVVIASSRARPGLRRTRAALGSVAAIAIVSAVGAGILPTWAWLAVGGFLSVAVPLALVGGLLRLVRDQGVTVQAVAGSLAIYLLVGLAFAWAIGLFVQADAAPYFASGAAATQSARVYYSFTVLTTTGFGDLTAATSAGHALAVVEMLVGQLYLVTVIGVVVGSFRRRQ
jgi:hypothetical protein